MKDSNAVGLQRLSLTEIVGHGDGKSKGFGPWALQIIKGLILVSTWAQCTWRSLKVGHWFAVEQKYPDRLIAACRDEEPMFSFACSEKKAAEIGFGFACSKKKAVEIGFFVAYLGSVKRPGHATACCCGEEVPSQRGSTSSLEMTILTDI